MPDKPVSPIQSASFAAIARRISGWTTNLVATGIIAVLALVVGRQLIVWWQVEPGGSSGPPSASAVPLASFSLSDLGAGESLELGFGQMPYRIQCRLIRGDANSAADALVAACRDLAAKDTTVFPDFGSAEASLLKLAARATPVAHGPGDIEVFASREGMPLVVVTSAARDNRPAESLQAGSTPAAPTPARVPPQLGAGQRRVLIWGLAAAAAEDQWNLYVAHASKGSPRGAVSPSAGRSSEAVSPAMTQDTAPLQEMVPIPPGSHRSLSVWDARGGLSAFAGSGRTEDWVAFYSAWFKRKPWIASQPWRPAGGCWHARFERVVDWGRETVDVQFGPDGAAGLVGLISIAGAEPPAGK